MKNKMHFNEYDSNEIEQLRNIQLMILKDFIKICEDNNIKYMAYGGTLLGAIRHGGFIPWDDDIDVILFRKDYDKFVSVFKSLNSKKYSFITSDDNNDYFYWFGKLSLNNTQFMVNWAWKTEFKLGIHIDVFVFDDVPDNSLKYFIYALKIKILSKICLVFMVDLNKNYPSKLKKIIADVGIKFLKLFRITPQKVNNYYKKLVYSNKDTSRVFENIAQTYTQPIPKSLFYPLKKVPFEDILINVPQEYDKILTIFYGDYMKLPPEEDRLVHPHDYIDFGKY